MGRDKKTIKNEQGEYSLAIPRMVLSEFIFRTGNNVTSYLRKLNREKDYRALKDFWNEDFCGRLRDEFGKSVVAYDHGALYVVSDQWLPANFWDRVYYILASTDLEEVDAEFLARN